MPLDPSSSAQLDPELLAQLEQVTQATGQLTAYESVVQALFPTGIPRSSPSQTVGIGQAAEEGAESLLGNLGVEQDPDIGDAFDSASGAIGEAFGAVVPSEFTDPDTGAIKRKNGVLVDPSADPGSGVYYPPNSDVEGSYNWLNKTLDWDKARAEKWRGRLNKLGYEIPEKGDGDEGLRTALDTYFRRKYFYGKETKLDAASGGRQRAEDVMDPVEIRQDVRAAYQTVFGDDPSDAELEVWEDSYRRTLNRILSRGRAPEQAVTATKEKFATKFTNDPGVKKYNELETENTELADSFNVLFQSLGNLA